MPTVAQPMRVAEFDAFFARDVRAARRVSETELNLVLLWPAEPTARDLAEREGRCCTFFTFDFVPIDGAVVMSVRVPESQVRVLDALQARAVDALSAAGRSR